MSAKNAPMSYNSMIEDARSVKTNSKLYKAKSLEISDARISELVAQCAVELLNSASCKPITLNDTETVKQQTITYISACAEAACFPSVNGWARSMGFSRNALYDFRNRNPEHETSRWIDMTLDAFSEIITQSALRNNCNSIVAIFIQKAQYGMREQNEYIKPIVDDPLGKIASREEIIDKYKDLPED